MRRRLRFIVLRPFRPQKIEKVLTRDFFEDGVFFRVFYRNLALFHRRVLSLPFIVLLQNKHTTLAENVENLISAQPRISAHSQGCLLYTSDAADE